MNILIFGLGSHGGGVSAARYFAAAGHTIRVTDLQQADALQESLNMLSDHAIEFILGTHRMEDVLWADLVIKNPAVPSDAPLLCAAKELSSDIGYFFRHTRMPLLTITGTKGKSTTTALLSHILSEANMEVFTGGNIGISPLEFIDQVQQDRSDRAAVVLELSSWQIHDLSRRAFRAPQMVIFTSILPDHQDRYQSMDAYIRDKLSLFSAETPVACAVLPADDRYLQPYLPDITAGSIYFFTREDTLAPPFSGISYAAGVLTIYDNGQITLQRTCTFDTAYLPAVSAACAYGIPLPSILSAVETYQGIAHRRELVRVHDHITYINDSAATIPEAVRFTLSGISQPVHLICGGCDKQLDPEVLAAGLQGISSIHLLAGSFTDRLKVILDEERIPYFGPFSSMDAAISSARQSAGSDSTILLSPGAASFGLFRNEFDRGDRFRAYVRSL